VCNAVARIQIELELAGGARLKAVARKYAVPYHGLQRHWKSHVDEERKARLVLGPVQVQALRARVAEENSSVIDNLKITRAGLFQSYEAAMKSADLHAVATIAGRLHENLRLLASITGELASSPLVSINNNSQTNNNILVADSGFAAFQARLIAVLRKFPDARDAVIAEFQKLETPEAVAPKLTHEPARTYDADA